MNESVTSRLPWRSLLIIGMVAMVAVPSWSLSQQPSDDKKPEAASNDRLIRLTGQDVNVQGDVVVELVADDKQLNPRESDRLDRLEKQLDALLKEIKTLRGDKATKARPANPVLAPRFEGKVIISDEKKDEPKKAEKGEKREFKEVIIFTDKKDEPKKAEFTDKKDEPKKAEKGEKARFTEVTIVGDKKEEPKKAGQGAKSDMRFEVTRDTKAASSGKAQWTTTRAKDGQTFAFTFDAADGDSTMLSRTTYKMPKEKAEALANFLKDQVKSPVLETKVDGDSIVVTTTPEAQKTIGQFIGLVQGKSIQARFNVIKPGGAFKASEPIKVHFDEKLEKR